MSYSAEHIDGIAPLRRNVDAVVMGFADRLVRWVAAHWLAVANAFVLVFAALPILAPYLISVGLNGLALALYTAYSFTCHQLPERSFFIFGHQMAYCERCTAIYLASLAAGLVYASRRDTLRGLSFRTYLLLIAPMAIDGFTQLFGWRESTWELRVVTGTLFGAASVWLAYPYMDRAFADLRG